MDREELERFRAGDRAVLETIYWRHIDVVEALLRSGLRRAGRFSAANVADLVQDVFAKAFSAKARAGYDGTRPYRPFLQQICRNTLIDWLRRNKRELVCALDLDRLAEDLEGSGEPQNEGFSADVVATAQRFIVNLEPELKAVHERRFLAAESQEQAAQALGISRQTLRTLERRLLDGLRRELRLADLAERRRLFSQPSARVRP